MADDNNDLIELTADIASAYLGKNSTATGDVPTLIQIIHAALVKLREPIFEEMKPDPAVPVRSSVKHDYIVCLEDGAKLKMLKRYLRTRYDMTPEDYRKKWDLPRDYPMVAPAYTETRRGLALSTGLGRKKVAEVVESIKTSASEALDAARERISGSEAPKPKARRAPKPKTVSAKSAS